MDIYGLDGYKYSHSLMDPPEIGFKSFYIEARNLNLPVVMARFQSLIVNLARYYDFGILEQDEAFFKLYGAPLNVEGLQDLAALGYLPLKIQVLPEGTATRTGVPMLQITNTHEDYPYLPGMLEDYLLQGHDSANVATQSFVARNIIGKGMDKSCENRGKLPWMLNDFGLRQSTCMEAGAVLGVGHCMSFLGSDNTPAGLLIQDDYNTHEVFVNTIPATEHSVMTLSGRDGELAFVRELLQKFIDGNIDGTYKEGTIPGDKFAMVIDSYGDENFVKVIFFGGCRDLIDILAGQGKCVILRPDSGDATTKIIAVLGWIEECIPTEININSKGYKQLPAYVSTIQGDGISIMTDKKTLQTLCDNVIAAGWALDVTCFGSGGALLSGLNRDSLGWAYKLSAFRLKGSSVWEGVGKETPGKVSRKGRLSVIEDINGMLVAIPEEELGDRENMLVTIFLDELIEENVQTFQQGKDRLAGYTLKSIGL